MGWSLDACVDQGRLSRRNIQESDDFKETLLVLELGIFAEPGSTRPCLVISPRLRFACVCPFRLISTQKFIMTTSIDHVEYCVLEVLLIPRPHRQ